MYGNVAANTFAAGLKTQSAMRNGSLSLKSGVTLQAQLAAFATNQQHAIRTSMRTVARDAAAGIPHNFSRRMLIDKGAVFLDVTCGACFRDRLNQV
jgi:hypothetical protein